MNKAFIREADTTDTGRCPRCGSLGTSVGEETLRSQLPEAAYGQVAWQAFFCPHPPCEVAYFDSFDRVVSTSALRHPVYPKDAEAPMCGCFGFTRDDVEQDLREGDVQRTRELLQKAKSPAARCVQTAADGQCCAAEVQRYFHRRREELGPV